MRTTFVSPTHPLLGNVTAATCQAPAEGDAVLCAGLPESLRRAAGVDLRAKQAYAEQLQARGGGGVSTAAEATARTVCARCLQDPVSDTGCPVQKMHFSVHYTLLRSRC